MVDKTESVCRICLAESSQCVSLYEANNDFKYNELIKEFVGLEIQQRENLPSVICNLCSSELMTVVSFISKCRASDEKLKEALDRNIPFYEITVEEINLIPFIIKKEENNSVDELPEDDVYDDIYENKKEVKAKKQRYKEYKKGTKKTICTQPFDFFLCQICGLNARSKSALINHNRTHTGVRPFVCDYCDKSFSLKCTLKDHILRKHMSYYSCKKKNFTCDFCGHRCYKKTDLKVHLRTHTKEKPYQCKYCPKSFSQLSAHIQHTRTHTGERPYPCHVCQKRFISRSCLKSHLSVHSNEKNFNCHICNKSLKSRGSLRAHLKSHTSENRFSCEKCDAFFTQKISLQRHVQAKHSELSGTCDICKKVVSNIVVHNRRHNGERPFECTVCKKKFSRENYLNMHFKLHSEPTKYSCKEDNCDAAFPLRAQLEFHVYKTHGSYFPYACKICSKGYYRKSDLGKHKIYGNCKSSNKKEKIP